MDISGYSVNKSTLEERQRNLTYTRFLYLLLAVELIIALIWTSFCISYWNKLGAPIVKWWEFGLVAGILSGLLILATFFVAAVRRFPINWAIYFLFTLVFAHFWAFLCCLDETRFLYFALWLLTAISIGFALYSTVATYYMQTTESTLVVLGSSLPVLLAFLAFTEMDFFILILVYIPVVIFGIYLALDLRTMLKHNLYDTNEEDAVAGAVRIWIESVLVFCRLGELVGSMFYKPKVIA